MTEIYDNINAKKAQNLDAKLQTVATVALLPDPTVVANFIYEGAICYVAGVIDKHYKCVMNSDGTALEWVVLDPADLVIGTINITPGTSVLDLSIVSPAIALCYAVNINVVGGTSATIQSVLNMPGNDKLITFQVTTGQQIKFKHFDYDVATSNQIVMEVGFDKIIEGRTIGNESLTLKQHGVALAQWDATQFMKASEWAQNLLSIGLADNLTSTSTTTALTANQGRVLNNLVATKQNLLTAGQKIQLVPGTNPTDPTVINALPRDWAAWSGIVPITTTNVNVLAWLVTLFTGTTLSVSEEYRFVDLRTVAARPDMGLWMIPPGHDATLGANWIQLDAPRNESSIKYSYNLEANMGTALTGGQYYFKMNPGSSVGTDIGVIWNTDGSTSIATTFGFSGIGIYEIEIDMELSIAQANAANLAQYDINLYETNGPQLSTAPTTGGSIKIRKSLPVLAPFGAGAINANRYANFKMAWVANVTTVGTSSGFTLQMNNNGVTAATFASISAGDNNFLRITKIS
jgi:hypothetical protein